MRMPMLLLLPDLQPREAGPGVVSTKKLLPFDEPKIDEGSTQAFVEEARRSEESNRPRNSPKRGR